MHAAVVRRRMHLYSLFAARSIARFLRASVQKIVTINTNFCVPWYSPALAVQLVTLPTVPRILSCFSQHTVDGPVPRSGRRTVARPVSAPAAVSWLVRSRALAAIPVLRLVEHWFLPRFSPALSNCRPVARPCSAADRALVPATLWSLLPDAIARLVPRLVSRMGPCHGSPSSPTALPPPGANPVGRLPPGAPMSPPSVAPSAPPTAGPAPPPCAHPNHAPPFCTCPGRPRTD